MASSSIKTRYFGAFRGVDYSSDQSEVADYRLAECENMYKDYHSGQGQAIETIPGFRLINDFGAKIYGIHVYQKGDEKTLIVHAGNKLYYMTNDGKWEHLSQTVPVGTDIGNYDELIMNERKSSSFNFNNRLYIIDGKNYVFYSDGAMHNVLDNAYIPTTHISLLPDNSKLEEPKNSGEKNQRNILSETYKVTFVADGEKKSFSLPSGVDSGSNFVSTKITAVYDKVLGMYVNHVEGEFDNNIDVYQYGIRLPFCTKKDGKYEKPVYIERDDKGTPIKDWYYPNAIISVSDAGVVTLLEEPPKTEDNEWYIQENGAPASNLGPLKTFPAGYAGIEIVAKKKVTTIKGITASSSDVGAIITGCTIVTVHDGRVFLSGNPEYPNFVFYCGRNPETGYIDPSYFGIVDWFSEGVTNTPITALMPIADTLMVLRKDTVQDGSVTYRTRLETNKDVPSVLYQGTGGLPGVGCLGASCSFLDDPVFVSKYGIEAMGQLSARYERAIEHRSSLIDGLLLNKNLENASIAEFDGYMWVLIEGEIFLADSRQRYMHTSGVMNYEWFYLKDIGIYKDQKRKRVYGEVPPLEEGKDTFTNGYTYKIISVEDLAKYNIDNKDRYEKYKIGDDVEEGYYNITYSPEDEEKVYHFQQFIAYDELRNPSYLAVYLELLEYMDGGKFDPATLIKTVDHDKLMFGTDGGSLCMFNFDKRNPKDNYKIPNEYYTFNGRIIKSALSTKMDNCGVLNYVKNTVKKSMVVKMKTFERSGAKVYVRTNRQTGHEVERLIGGRFDDAMSDLGFNELTYETDEKNIFRVREKEKKWLEKQITLLSDSFKEPFALHYIAYDFFVAGRYKD